MTGTFSQWLPDVPALWPDCCAGPDVFICSLPASAPSTATTFAAQGRRSADSCLLGGFCSRQLCMYSPASAPPAGMGFMGKVRGLQMFVCFGTSRSDILVLQGQSPAGVVVCWSSVCTAQARFSKVRIPWQAHRPHSHWTCWTTPEANLLIFKSICLSSEWWCATCCRFGDTVLNCSLAHR